MPGPQERRVARGEERPRAALMFSE